MTEERFEEIKAQRRAIAGLKAGAADELIAEVESLQDKIIMLRDKLSLVDYVNRTRGYPMPKEWNEIVLHYKAALEQK